MPLRVGCNYSAALVELLRAGRVAVDYLCLTRLEAVEEELREARAFSPVLIHVLGRAGVPPETWDSLDWQRLNRVIARADAPHVALHLDIRAEDWPRGVDLRAQERNETTEMIERIQAAFENAAQRLDCPLLFENVPYYGYRGAHRVCADPALMWQLAAKGVGMLLDVAHLRCTAYHLGVDVRGLARSMPLGAVRELHVSGPTAGEQDGLRDTHGVLSEEDYKLLAWLLEETDPAVVTLEYGGTDPAFEMEEADMAGSLQLQLYRLRDLVDRSSLLR
jgi:uncharacterized protein (UPF0276 family)